MESKDKIRALELELAEARAEKRQKVTPNVLGGYSNSIKATKDYPKDHVRFTIRFKDRLIEITELDINQFGLDLRQSDERKVGHPIGPLIRFDHTVIQDERRLRQSQCSYRPQFIVALPADHNIERGQAI